MAPASGDSLVQVVNRNNPEAMLKLGANMWNEIEAKYWESSAVVRQREDREVEDNHRSRQAEVSSRIYELADEHHRLKLRGTSSGGRVASAGRGAQRDGLEAQGQAREPQRT